MSSPAAVAQALADTLLAREASLASMQAGVAWTLGVAHPAAPALCAALIARTGAHFHSFSRQELAELILDIEAFQLAWEPGKTPPHVLRYCLDLPLASEAPAWLLSLSLPALPTVGALAHWLSLAPPDLGWFADQWRETSSRPLQHYHYRWVPKRSGAMRLIEIPKQRLRAMQQTILRELLDRVPVHPAAHGFRRGHSCLTHAALHTGQRVVVRMDLKDFFPSVPASRVHALFEKLGYSHTVAGTLARLCVNRTPATVAGAGGLAWQQRQLLRSAHLPQGSPCSPALANLSAFRLDVRLAAFAQSMDATYSRYADDLVFSGGSELERALERFHVRVAAIAIEEGFQINTRKTRMMRQGVRQQITGVVVNRHANVARAEFDQLKAILHNCVTHGPQAQNREQRGDFRAYLTGKVAWVSSLNRVRGDKLRALLDAIAWGGPAGRPF